MSTSLKKIQVFEHQTLHYGREYEHVLFKEAHFNALVKLNEYHKNKTKPVEVIKGKIIGDIIKIPRPENCEDCGDEYETGRFKYKNGILYDANIEGGYNEYYDCTENEKKSTKSKSCGLRRISLSKSLFIRGPPTPDHAPKLLRLHLSGLRSASHSSISMWSSILSGPR
jgi:hypothetical protein